MFAIFADSHIFHAITSSGSVQQHGRKRTREQINYSTARYLNIELLDVSPK